MMPALLGNAGIPMLLLHIPMMAVLLIPVVAIEQWVVGRSVSLPGRTRWNGVIVCNLASTLLGWPIAWGLLLALQVVLEPSVDNVSWLHSPMREVMQTIVTPAWLAPPTGGRGLWIVPLATLVLLLPYFLISFWIERACLLWYWKSSDAALVEQACVHMNVVSYLDLFVGSIAWLLGSLG